MRFYFFTKLKLVFISISIIILMLISAVMYVFDLPTPMIFSIWFFFLIPVVLYIILDYLIKKRYYNRILETIDNLEEKYLLPNVIDAPSFIEGQILYEILYSSSKSMLEKVNAHEQVQEEYREYIEQWVHEIKTPIAAAYLLVENGSDKMDVIDELTRVDSYIQQVLYYARSQDPHRDFFVKEFNISDSIDAVLKKNVRRFIASGIRLKYTSIDSTVFADSKWTSYILDQIIGNSIKYAKSDNKEVSIYGAEEKEKYILTIEDNGIGIPKKDLDRIFDKGFTGENGRKIASSTGMGLYICKSLCDKLYIGLVIESESNVGTKVKLCFPKKSLFSE